MRPYVLVSCAVSLDGRLDDATPERLILSGPADLARVDAQRAGVDAILVGAGTVRADDPRLLVRDPALVRARAERGRPPQPLRVVVTSEGDLDPGARLFAPAEGAQPPLVFAGESLRSVLADLAGRGVERLMIEGGAYVIEEALREDLVDELQVFVAPLLVGGAGTPRFGRAGPYPQGRMDLEDVTRLDDGVVLTYRIRGEGAR